MSGVTLSLTTPDLDQAIQRLRGIAGFDMAELVNDAGAILESSTRDRFETKVAPDGSEWPAWSEAYDDTRNHGVHSLLVEEGDLRDSIASYSTGDEVMIGTNLVYAAHHQIGGEEVGSGVPARPYLGASELDKQDLRDLVTSRLEDLLQ
ncbi:phage virion morphogenesis protein [Aliiroseovarius crassostreae]|uniref:phage virion morphogenesis protein n=1 Tax=Aliiroseovarius crassostreae TaxID=154981 RepID=UPI0021AF9A2E|nr:phage virion morphogenesis protein [Aliiroseovarius crassostreae]UWQ00850.1 phage virion morphogenesis protein [Aliiroseovarius crassostreae]